MIFIFKGFYAGSFTPLNTIYSTEVVSYRIRAAGLSLFRLVTSGFGYGPPSLSPLYVFFVIVEGEIGLLTDQFDAEFWLRSRCRTP